MKRITTVMMMLFMAILSYGQKTYTASFDGADNVSDAGWFTFEGAHNFNAKYTGTYAGVNYVKGLKLESTSVVIFTTKAKSTVTIVQSLAANNSNYMGFDGTNMSGGMRVDDSAGKVGVYTLSDVAAGTHKITRGTGETGLLFLQVDEAQYAAQLEAPVVTFDAETGLVTIAAVDNALSVVYTTDGSVPSADNGTVYKEPFNVADGTTVKAIALGDEVNNSNSDVSTVVVLLNNAVIQSPVLTVFNGTVKLTTTSTATLEYSLDGTDYVPYVVPFTLLSDATVYARAVRNGKYSEVTAQPVTAVAKPAGTTTVILSGGTMSGSANSVTFSDAPGYSLAITGNTLKTFSRQGQVMVDGNTYDAIKLSNGAQNTLTLPEGMVAKRITLYSIINATTGEAGWKEVDNTDYQSGEGDYKLIPMGAFNTLPNVAETPDVRVYAVEGNQVTFTNAGQQLCFVIVVDVASEGVETETLHVAASGYTTYAAGYDVDYSADGMTAFAINYDDVTNKIDYHPITGVVPANTAVMVKGTPSTDYTLTPASATATTIDTDLKKADGVLTADGTHYGFATVNGLSGFYRIVSGEVIPARKGYLVISSSNAKAFYGIDQTTGIGSAELNTATDTPRYNLAGQRVDASYKGIILQNNRKYINK